MKNIIAIILFSVAYNLSAQEQIITDRPDQTESPNAVGIGVLQIETGVLFERTEINSRLSEHRIVYPTNLFRIGVAKKLELRIVNEIVSYKTVDNTMQKELSKISGTENMQVGFKYQLSESDKRAIIGIMAHVVVPTGSRGISNQKYGVLSRINVSYDLTENRNISGNFGYNNTDLRFSDDNGLVRDEDGDFTYTLVYGHSLNDRLGVYLEAFGDYVNFEDWVNNMDAGFTYLLNDNIQLDYSYGWGLNQVMNYHSIGISVRVGQ